MPKLLRYAKKLGYLTLLACFCLFFSFHLFTKERFVTQAEKYSSSFSELAREGNVYISEPISTSIAFHAIAGQLTIPYDNLLIELRTYEKDGWSPWQVMPGDIDTKYEDEHYTQMLFTPLSTAFQYRITPFNTKALEGNISFSYYNATGKKVELDISAPKDALAQLRTPSLDLESGVISRADWGADDNLLVVSHWNKERAKICGECKINEAAVKASSDKAAQLVKDFPEETKVERTTKFKGGEELVWPVQTSKSIKKLVVHHTAENEKDSNGDGTFTIEDEKANLRAVYYFHTVTRGWGDIGYNYIVGKTGAIYEGRYGGKKAVAAHAIWRNISSIGISVMGNFEESELPTKQKNALVFILKREATRFGLDPKSSSMFYGEWLPNIVGHRDVGQTLCPGSNIYDRLEEIRNNVASDDVSFSPEDITPIGIDPKKTRFNSASKEYSSDYTTNRYTFVFSPGGTQKLELTFKNTGTSTWNSKTYLHIKDNTSKFISVNGVEGNSNKASLLPPGITEVKPGQSVTFPVTITTGFKAIERPLEFTPVVNGTRFIQSAILQVKLSTPTIDYSFVRATYPEKRIFFGEKASGTFTLRNTGNITWYREGSQRIVLRPDKPTGRESSFLTKEVPVFGTLKEKEVAPGAEGTFVISAVAPRKAGNYKEYFTAAIDGYGYLPSKELFLQFQVVDPRTRLNIEGKRGKEGTVPSLGYGESYETYLEVENTSSETWKGLKGLEIDIFSLKTPGVTVSSTGTFTEDTIAPGKAAKIAFTITAPNRTGKMFVRAYPKMNGKFLFKDGGQAYYSFSVLAPIAKAEIQGNTIRTVKMSLGEEQLVEVKIKNSGNITWKKEDTGFAFYTNRKEPHPLLHETWKGGLKPAILEESEVKPGETGTFRFLILPKKGGTFSEELRIGVKNVGWLSMPSLILKGEVTGTGTITSIKRTTGDSMTPVLDATTPSSESTVRVKLSVNQSNAQVAPWSEGYKLYVDGNYEGVFTKEQPATVEILQKELYVKNSTITKKATTSVRLVPVKEGDVMEIKNFYRFPAWDSKKEYNDNLFKGNLEFRFNSENGMLLTINELGLTDYLKGVAEVPGSDPVEKQKVLAILARTYVLFYMDPANRKFPGKPYDASDDPDVFQKYLGHRFTMRASYWEAAVAATDREVVTYNGKLVKTPYFSESDGRTRSAQEVWKWTDTPYLVGVADTYCNGGKGTLRGHGVGLSGCGATGMANQGKNYKEIITYYYKGVKIEKK